MLKQPVLILSVPLLHGKDEEDVIEKLEEDALEILSLMASNGQAANPSKMEFMIMKQMISNLLCLIYHLNNFLIHKSNHT